MLDCRGQTSTPTLAAWPTSTYVEVGATRGPDLPAGYHHVVGQRVVGRGAGDFQRAAEAVMRWDVQRGAGLRVAGAERAVEGGFVSVRLGLGPFGVDAPCVVVYTVDEPRRRGFAYGTLPGHPETGEERFVMEHREDDTVVLTIRAFSRPARWWSRAAGPVTRLVQRAVPERYLRALSG